ncbi:MAG: hypothetical protein RMH81_00720 [Thermomicrobium sp.]|nr:hypothetical protein [Thermomicrobium sp.]
MLVETVVATIVLLVLACGALAFVVHPLWIARGRLRATPSLPTRLLDAFAERDAVLAALRDLQLDYETGKVAAEEYRLMRRTLLSETARVLRTIEELHHELDLNVEEEISQLRELAKQIDRQSSTTTAGVPT